MFLPRIACSTSCIFHVYHIVGLAGGHGSDHRGSAGGCAVDCLEVVATSSVTAAGSTRWFNCDWLELRVDQNVMEAISNKGQLRDSFLQAVRGMEHWEKVLS